MTTDLNTHIQNGLQELKTKRDEIHLKLHLAGMEAKTEWEDVLEPKLHQLEHDVEQAGEKAAETVKDTFAELQILFTKFAENLPPM